MPIANLMDAKAYPAARRDEKAERKRRRAKLSCSGLISGQELASSARRIRHEKPSLAEGSCAFLLPASLLATLPRTTTPPKVGNATSLLGFHPSLHISQTQVSQHFQYTHVPVPTCETLERPYRLTDFLGDLVSYAALPRQVGNDFVGSGPMVGGNLFCPVLKVGEDVCKRKIIPTLCLGWGVKHSN